MLFAADAPVKPTHEDQRIVEGMAAIVYSYPG
jgi:hypothetical protein